MLPCMKRFLYENCFRYKLTTGMIVTIKLKRKDKLNFYLCVADVMLDVSDSQNECTY